MKALKKDEDSNATCAKAKAPVHQVKGESAMNRKVCGGILLVFGWYNELLIIFDGMEARVGSLSDGHYFPNLKFSRFSISASPMHSTPNWVRRPS